MVLDQQAFLQFTTRMIKVVNITLTEHTVGITIPDIKK